MTDHTATWRSSTSGETGRPQSGGSRSVQGLAEQTREQALQAGDYLARNVQEYPFGALLIAGLVGYGSGYLIHGASSQEWRNRREIEETSEPRTLFMRQADWSRSPGV